MSREILLPCPFCGDASSLTELDDVVRVRWRVECDDDRDCGAAGPIRAVREEAIAAWNGMSMKREGAPRPRVSPELKRTKPALFFKSDDVEVEWIHDPGGRVDGQWRARSSFWEFYPTEGELEHLVEAGSRAIAARRAETEN